MHWFNILSLFALVAAILRYSRWRRRNPNGLPFPPGPKGYPLIGNLLDYPTSFAWTQYDRWSKKYGDLLYFEVLGQPFLILGSLKRTNDLFEKRSKNYSDRIWSPMVMDLMGCDFNFGLLPYGAPWRKRRRQFHEHFNSSISSQYIPVQADEVKTFLRSLLDSPESLLQHIRRTFAGTIMRIVYDIHVDSLDNEHALRAQAAIDSLSEAAVPGAFLVDFIPALKYIPSWFPGAGFRKKAENWRKINDDVRRIPFALVKEQHRNGSVQSSVASKIIKNLPEEDDPSYQQDECVAQDVTAVAFAAGADTTVSSVHAFFCAMAMYPEVMRQAQDEIDRVVGADRLPNIDDQPSLPFVRAVCKEILRWHNVIPLGVPHLTTNDDEYEGYFIPKGTLVFGNVWSILHDPDTFEKPFEFMPSRYMTDGEFDTTVLDPFVAGSFGFGRRVCPGRYLASNSLFLTISNVLAVYDILPPLGMDGNPEQLNFKTTSGLLAYPLPFNCRITPRNPSAEELVTSS